MNIKICHELVPPYKVLGDILYLTTIPGDPASVTNLALKREPFRVDRKYILAADEITGKIVGAVCLDENPRDLQFTIKIGYVSVSPAYKNKGVATKLVAALFEYAEQQQKSVQNSKYEPEGMQYLKPLLHRMKSNYSVLFYEHISYSEII